jgi:hypothetical protein
MADLASDPDAECDTPHDTLGAPDQGTLRWVKIFGIVIVVLVLLFVALHLTGHGFGGHTPHPSGAQPS